MRTALRHDALRTQPDGFALRIGLPWTRSLPLSCVLDLGIRLDDRELVAEDLEIVLGKRSVPLPRLRAAETTWWFPQDRLVVHGPAPVTRGGVHHVTVQLRLMLPHLSAGDGPAVLPFVLAQDLVADASRTSGSVSRDVV